MSDEIKTDLTCPDCETRTPAPMNEQGYSVCTCGYWISSADLRAQLAEKDKEIERLKAENLEQRRKDFEAGAELCAEQEGNQVGIEYDSFEDYIKRGKE